MARGLSPYEAHVGTGSVDLSRARRRNGAVCGAQDVGWRDRPEVASTKLVPAANVALTPDEFEARVRYYQDRVKRKLPLFACRKVEAAEPLMWCAWCLTRTTRKFCSRACRYAAGVSRAVRRARLVARVASRVNAANHRVSCRHCGREAFGRPDKVYCSRSCKTQAQNVRRRKGRPDGEVAA